VVVVRHRHILCISRPVDDLWQVEATHHCYCNLTKLSDRPAPAFLALMSVCLSGCLFVCPYIHLSIGYIISLSIQPSVHLLSIYRFTTATTTSSLRRMASQRLEHRHVTQCERNLK
jgi:hypothetical protein